MPRRRINLNDLIGKSSMETLSNDAPIIKPATTPLEKALKKKLKKVEPIDFTILLN